MKTAILLLINSRRGEEIMRKCQLNLRREKSLTSLLLISNNIKETRGSQEPVITHLVFNLTSKVNRKWGCYT